LQRFILAKRTWVLLAVAVCAAYFYGLGAVPFLGPDEPRYAQVAREMFARGDFVTPTLGGHTWFEKPALLYWLMMAAYGAFGVSEWAARLATAAAGVLTVLCVGWVGRRVEAASHEAMRGLGVVSAAVMASSAGLLVFARAATFDALLTATVTAALACFFVSELERDGRRRRPFLVGFYAFVGASLLAKGLVGVVIPALVVAGYFLLRRRWPPLLRLGLPWGVLLCLLVAALWYGPVTARHGWAFVDEFFVQHHFARYTSNKYHHPQPFYFYVPIVLLLALPWTFFLLSGLAGLREANARAEEAGVRARVLAAAWLLAPLLFFSLSGSKLPGYVLPALPGAALLAGERVLKYLRGGGEVLTMRLTGLLALALCAGGLVYAYQEFAIKADEVTRLAPFPVWGVVALVAPAGVSGALALFAARRPTTCVVSLVAATLLTVALAAAVVPDLELARHESAAQLLRRADAQGYGSLPVFQLHTMERSAEFYAAGRLRYDAEGQPVKFEGAWQAVEATRASGGRALVLVPVEYFDQLNAEATVEKQLVGENGVFALVLLTTRE
jgi:4-amino-4-deoxy-L-arabinose transferase-like glycosyltransferase